MQTLENLVRWAAYLYLSAFVLYIHAATLSLRVVVTLNRFWAVCFPISYRKRKKITRAVVLIMSWIFPIFSTIFLIVQWKPKENSDQINCHITKFVNFNMTIFVSCYASFHLLLIVLLYTIILRTIHKHVSNKFISDSVDIFDLPSRKKNGLKWLLPVYHQR